MARSTGALLCALLVAACSEEVISPAPQPLSCDAAEWGGAYDVVPREDVKIYLDLSDGVARDALAKDVGDVLERMWGAAPEIVFGAPDGSAKVSVWIGVSSAVQRGFALRREDVEGSTSISALGPDEYSAAVGAYALLEELGARFFHPLEDLVPDLGEVRLPKTLDVTRAPAFETRGVQFHTLHPIEYFEPLMVPGEENLANAKKLVDWLVKTGHNEAQWWILDERPAGWEQHSTAIIDYAHARGVEIAALVQLSKASSLQGAHGLVSDGATTEQGEAEIRDNLDEVLTVPWDHIELALGEFLGGDPDQLIDWLDTATEHLASHDPPLGASVVNHVGGDLYVDYQGESVFFYFLPQFADARLENNVHTVFFFDLYRKWGGYGHDDFFGHRDFLFENLGKRPMSYTPESAYWASADIDVPLFLPNYLTARSLDVRGIVKEPREMGLPPVGGHILFSSGHEWGYWLTDYLTAKMLWQPEAPLKTLTKYATSAFGSCGGSLDKSLGDLIRVEDDYLFDQHLVGYLSGEDVADDAGAALGIETTPRRRAYDEVGKLTGEERDAFQRDVVEALDAFAAEVEPIAQALSDVCAYPDERSANFCSELADGAQIVALRARHSALLYRAVLEPDLETARGLLDEAASKREEAAKVIARREKGYRFPVAKLVEPFENGTIYDWGYLRQAHLLCYWDRQALQADNWVEYQSGGSLGLPTCDI